ncbi:hypothetical protein KHA80_08995 [Anaerobacillus sp. HL2]|nr:hypothetical protein KHA80_08995 [Anaerobacillus sp. HL2]
MGIFSGLRGRLILLGYSSSIIFVIKHFYIVPSLKEDIYNEKELANKGIC